MSMEGKERVILTIIMMLWWGAGNCTAFDSTVAQDGSGDYKTITEAVIAAPKMSTKTYFIHVKKGTYNENVTIPNEKPNIALVGDEVYGSGFIGISLTIRNTAGPEGGQAAALTIAPFKGFTSFYQCSFLGYQDTIFSSDTSFFRECLIFGTIDFITGSGRAVFQNCRLKARPPIHGQGVRILAPGEDYNNYFL
nr:probable pectinesterase/pectinesterase inhibitor 32 [Solanum lycopersicum]